MSNMALFGSDWLEGYDSLYEYETHVGGMATAKEYMKMKYDEPCIPPVHLEEEYDSLTEYESGIKHFKE